jgi:hypothetical protein
MVKEYHLSAIYKTVSTILFLGLIPYVDEIGGDDQCGVRRSRLTDGGTR